MRGQRRPGDRSGGRPRAGSPRAGRAPSAPGRQSRGTARTPRRESTPAPEPEPTAADVPVRRPSLTGRAAILALVLAALIVSYASSLKAWSEQRDQIASLEAELTERQQNVTGYEQDIERWKDPSYVEAQARERFGWVKPGEVGYIVVDGDEAVDGEPVGSAERDSERAQPPWWNTLWASVDRAGNPPEPKPEPASGPKTPEPADTIAPGGSEGPHDGGETDE